MYKRKLEELFNSEIKINGKASKVNVVAVLGHEDGSETLIPGANIVTNDGDTYYAQKAMGEAPTDTFIGIEIGTGTTAVDKTDTGIETAIAAEEGYQALDGTYPQTDDGDSDNTGAGVDIATWTATFPTDQGNSAGINEGAVVDNATHASVTAVLCHFLFAAPFTKTSSDTLKVIINHQFNGV